MAAAAAGWPQPLAARRRPPAAAAAGCGGGAAHLSGCELDDQGISGGIDEVEVERHHIGGKSAPHGRGG